METTTTENVDNSFNVTDSASIQEAPETHADFLQPTVYTVTQKTTHVHIWQIKNTLQCRYQLYMLHEG